MPRASATLSSEVGSSRSCCRAATHQGAIGLPPRCSRCSPPTMNRGSAPNGRRLASRRNPASLHDRGFRAVATVPRRVGIPRCSARRDARPRGPWPRAARLGGHVHLLRGTFRGRRLPRPVRWACTAPEVAKRLSVVKRQWRSAARSRNDDRGGTDVAQFATSTR